MIPSTLLIVLLLAVPLCAGRDRAHAARGRPRADDRAAGGGVGDVLRSRRRAAWKSLATCPRCRWARRTAGIVLHNRPTAAAAHRQDDPPAGLLRRARAAADPRPCARGSATRPAAAPGRSPLRRPPCARAQRARLGWWRAICPRSRWCASTRTCSSLASMTRWRGGAAAEMGLRVMARGEGTEFEACAMCPTTASARSTGATARHGMPITRQFQVERNQTLIVMIDAADDGRPWGTTRWTTR